MMPRMELLTNKGSKGGGKAVPYAAPVLAQMAFALDHASFSKLQST